MYLYFVETGAVTSDTYEAYNSEWVPNISNYSSKVLGSENMI